MLNRLIRSASYLALLGATVLVGFLTVQRRGLRAEVRDLRHRLEWAHTGLVVPSFSALTNHGDPAVIGQSAAHPGQILFVFNTRCPYCRETLPVWKEIMEQIASGKLPDAEVYALSLSAPEATRAYTEEHALNFPVVQFPSGNLRKIYRTQAVPLTLVVDSTGIVQFAGIGSLVRKPALRDSIAAALRFINAPVAQKGPNGSLPRMSSR